MNILLTSVGRRSYLVEYFKEALLGDGSVHVANSSALSPAFLVADKTVVTPLIYDDQYIPFLLQYCKENHIDAVISLFDVDLPVLSRNKKRFKEIGVEVIVSDIDVIEKCNDKWKTYQFLKKNHIHTPLTFLDLKSALAALDTKSISYPVIVKPRWGMGSIETYEADNREELIVFYEKVKRNIENTYMNYPV